MFQIIEYLDSLEKRLRELDPAYRSFFGAWCLRAAFMSWRDELSKTLDKADTVFIEQSVGALCKSLVSHQALSKQQLISMNDRCKAIYWPNEGQYPYADIVTLEMLAMLQAAVKFSCLTYRRLPRRSRIIH